MPLKQKTQLVYYQHIICQLSQSHQVQDFLSGFFLMTTQND